MKITAYSIEGQQYKVRSLMVGSNLWMHVNGQVWVIDQRPKSLKKNKNDQSDSAQGEIYAPMPGRILKVNVKKGDQIKKDQVVVVMEAMKMEYSLAATCDGEVARLNCQVGEQVELKSLLVHIQKKSKT